PLKIPVLRLAVRAPDWDAVRLADFTEHELTPRLRRIPEVEAVWTFGASRPEAVVSVDRDVLAPLGLTLTDVREAIDEANTPATAGTLDYPGARSIPLQMRNQADSVSDLGSVMLMP